MGRPAGSKNRKKNQSASTETEGDSSAAIGHNSSTVEKLNDDQLQSLFFQWKRHYQDDLAAKKYADAVFKNTCKGARSELGETAIDEIKTAILLESDDGEKKVRARVERDLRVARWMALPLGTQSNFVTDFDPRPLNERAAAEGKRDGLDGKPCSPPYQGEAEQAWLTGWHDGQALLVRRGITKPEDAESAVGANSFDDALEDAAEASAESTFSTTEGDAHIREVSAKLNSGDPGPVPEFLMRNAESVAVGGNE